MRKKAIILLSCILLSYAAAVPAFCEEPAQTPKPIRIMVEGLPDAKPTSLTTQKDVYFKNELYVAATKTAATAADIKVMAENHVTESEIMDAVISKLSDIEEELARQKILNTRMMAGSLILLVLVIFLAFGKRR